MTRHVNYAQRLQIVHNADRVTEPGLDIIVVHGISTISLQALPSQWYKSLSRKAPDNARILGFDASLNVSTSFKWSHFQQESDSLLAAMNAEYQSDADKNNRAFVFIGFAMAGVLIKHMMLIVDSRQDYSDYMKRTRGLAFLATPHINGVDQATSSRLSNIISGEKLYISREDLLGFTECSRRFEMLELSCDTLSCYEKVEVKVKHRFRSRTVQGVDKRLAESRGIRTPYNEYLVGIDCKLSQLFSSTDYAIHTSIAQFLERSCNTVANFERYDDWTVLDVPATTIPGQSQLPQARIAEIVQAAAISTQSSMPSASAEYRPEPTGPRTPDNTFSQRPVPESFSNDRFSTVLSSSLASAAQSTPRNVSLDSNNSYVMVLDQSDAGAPIVSPITVVQNQLYETSNKDFQGRHVEHADIDATLLPSLRASNERNPRTYVLYGRGGSGKTQTALAYLHRRKAQYPVSAFLQARNRESLSSGMQMLAVALGLQDSDVTKQNPAQARNQVMKWLKQPRQVTWKQDSPLINWLIVFDDVVEERVLSEFLPAGAPGSIIITTRAPMVQERMSSRPSNDKQLGPLCISDSVALLRSQLPESILRRETEERLVAFVKFYDCWPLFIVHMAGKMQHLGQSTSKFLQIYQEKKVRMNYYGPSSNNLHGYEYFPALLYSLDELKEPGARSLASVISILFPEAIPSFVLEDVNGKATLEGYPDVGELGFALAELVQNSIVTRVDSDDDDSFEINIHSLTQEVIQAQLLRDEEQFAEVFNCTVRLLMAVWRDQSTPSTRYRELVEKSRWRHCRTLLPHLRHVRSMRDLLGDTARSETVTNEFLFLMNETGWHHYLLRELEEAVDYAQATIKIIEESGHAWLSHYANQYATLSSVAMVRNQPKLARSLYQQCFDINQELFRTTGQVQSQLVAAYTNLAQMCILDNDLMEARRLIQESVRLRQQMNGFNRLQLFTPLLLNSYIENLSGEYETAEAHLLVALEDRKIAYGSHDNQSNRRGQLLYSLGKTLGRQGAKRAKESRDYFRGAYLQFQDTSSGDHDVDAAHAAYELAILDYQAEAYASGLEMVEQAAETYNLYKDFDAELSRCLFLKSRICEKCLDPDGARTAMDEAVRLRARLLPDEAVLPDTLVKDNFDALVSVFHR